MYGALPSQYAAAMGNPVGELLARRDRRLPTLFLENIENL